MFSYVEAVLCCEQVPLAQLAQTYGTPLYVYSAHTLQHNFQRLAAAFAPLQPRICYAVKANANLAILRRLRAAGAGFDIVSGGELFRALRAGADPAHIVFAGVGKTDKEMTEALAAGVGWFNVESGDELARLNALAQRLGQRATVALRLNPAVEADTHHHIQTGHSGSKFGLAIPAALALTQRAAEFPALTLRGAHIHIGSQIPNAAPTLAAIERALDFIAQANTHLPQPIDHLDLGGGFPVAYRAADAYAALEDFAAPIVARLQPLVGQLHFHLEPGRFLVAEAGVLLTTIQTVKDIAGRRTYVVDAGMNTLLRPALYDAYHPVLPVQATPTPTELADVVGPICESADVLARDRALPLLPVGAVLAFSHAGAYGFSMASHYNSHPRPAEVLVQGSGVEVIRQRETYADLVQGE